MTRPLDRLSAPPRIAAEDPVDLLMHALRCAVPTGLLDLLLDGIEARR